jgi:glucuronokinase
MAREHLAGRGVAPGRAALAGNPSDGYGGAVLAVAFSEIAAEVEVPHQHEPVLVRSPPSLIAATITRFARDFAPSAANCPVTWRTSIPRSVGLGGSSAIVIATLRALCERHQVTLEPGPLAELALAIEVEDLGIAAGPQDRVAQAYGGLTFMDFATSPPRYERLDPALLPPLLIAWRPAAAQASGDVHEPLTVRFARGEPVVRYGMRRLAAAAREGHRALLVGDLPGFRHAVDASFDIRRELVALDPRHVEMISVARGAGAAANYTGSGGAIVCACLDQDHRRAVCEALRDAPCEVLVLAD